MTQLGIFLFELNPLNLTINSGFTYFSFRLEYDACRTELELLPIGSKMSEKQDELQKYKEKYEQLKSDVSIKLKFLDENQVSLILH